MNNNSCGCNQMPSCNQVVETYNVEMIPHYTNYHTTHINNCIKRHINIPVFTDSFETVVTNEYVAGMPIYQSQCQMAYPNMDTVNQNYTGNVGTNPSYNPFYNAR